MEERKLLISVIIPVYKVEKYLVECVESVLAQTYTNIEVILVDDGSPDNSPALCDKFAESYPSIIKSVHKENGGLSDARNFGLKIATGDYILFLDSDDYWGDMNAIQLLVDEINTNKDIDVLYFDRTYVLGHSQTIKSSYDINQINGKSKTEIIKYLIGIDKFMVSACTKLVKRSILVDNNIEFKKGLLSEDYDWNFSVIIYSKVLHAVDSNFYMYRLREDSISHTVSDKHLFDIWGIIKDWVQKVPSMVQDVKEKELYLDFLAYMYGMLMSLIFCSKEKAQRNKLIKEMKEYKFLLKRKRSAKMRSVSNLYSIVGFDLTWRILGVRNRIKNRNI